jgi:hypothetical protein
MVNRAQARAVISSSYFAIRCSHPRARRADVCGSVTQHSRQRWSKPHAVAFDHSEAPRQLPDELRFAKEDLGELHDVLRYDIVRKSKDNDAAVLIRRVIANVGEVQISGQQSGLARLSMCCKGAIRRGAESYVSRELCFMAKTSDEVNDRARKVCVDQETNWS